MCNVVSTLFERHANANCIYSRNKFFVHYGKGHQHTCMHIRTHTPANKVVKVVN